MSKRVFFNSPFNIENKKELLLDKAVMLSFIFLLFNSTLSFGNLAIYTPYIYSSLSPIVNTSSSSSATMFDKVLYTTTQDSDDSFNGTVPQITLTFYPVNAFCTTGFATTGTTSTKNIKCSNFQWGWALTNNRIKNDTANLYDLEMSKIINP